MNWVDLLIAGVVAWTTFRAFSNGLIREAVSLLSLVAGLVLSGAYYDDLSANLEFLVADETTRRLAAFAAIFLGTAIAGQVIGMILRSVAAVLMLGPLDKIGGAAFGFLKGLLFVQVFLIAVSVFPAATPVSETVAASKLAPIFLDRIPLAQFGLPEEFSNPLGQLDRWRQIMPGVTPSPAPSLRP